MRFFIVFCVAISTCLTMPVGAQDFELQLPLGLKRMRVPRDNPLSKAKIELGKQLFFDARLSRDNTISCASCHDPKKGWSNGSRFATGIDKHVGGRSAPTIINSGFQYFQFWDGRALQLEGQALGPIENPIEMDMKLADLEVKLNKIQGYRSQFQKIFTTDVTSEGIAKAIASFERTVLSGGAPYDRFKDADESALSAAAQRGMKIFFNKAKCSSCHSGGNFTDGGFHNVGVGMDEKKPDLGRFSVTKLEGDRGSFKTATLREIARTAPYMHDGRFSTLQAVINFYNAGGIKNPQLSEDIFPLKLSDQEINDLAIFLTEGLSSPDYPTVEPPELPK